MPTVAFLSDLASFVSCAEETELAVLAVLIESDPMHRQSAQSNLVNLVDHVNFDYLTERAMLRTTALRELFSRSHRSLGCGVFGQLTQFRSGSSLCVPLVDVSCLCACAVTTL